MADETIRVITEKENIVPIADAVRSKTGSTDEMTLDGIINGINSIETGVDTSDATATAADILSGETAYANGKKITGTMAITTQATPSISVNSNGLITASATQSAGYVAAGTKSDTKQLTTQTGKTVTPTTSEQTVVEAGRYTTGAVKVAKIPDSYIQPSGTKTITENGTHDVTEFASVDVNVAGSGGGGAAVEYEIITIPAGATTATYTLPRVTAAYGSLAEPVGTIYNSDVTNAGYIYIMGIHDTLSRGIAYIGGSSVDIDSDIITYHNGVISLSGTKTGGKVKLLLVNDPNANAISY